MDDGRKVNNAFSGNGGESKVVVTFEAGKH
jgi:hypothetical protein